MQKSRHFRLLPAFCKIIFVISPRSANWAFEVLPLGRWHDFTIFDLAIAIENSGGKCVPSQVIINCCPIEQVTSPNSCRLYSSSAVYMKHSTLVSMNSESIMKKVTASFRSAISPLSSSVSCIVHASLRRGLTESTSTDMTGTPYFPRINSPIGIALIPTPFIRRTASCISSATVGSDEFEGHDCSQGSLL
jgi:hypothetical protein